MLEFLWLQVVLLSALDRYTANATVVALAKRWKDRLEWATWPAECRDADSALWISASTHVKRSLAWELLLS